MAVYYKKYKKISPYTGKLEGFACKMLILLPLELQSSSCNIAVMQTMHHSEFDIFKMAVRMLADTFYKPVGAAPSLS